MRTWIPVFALAGAAACDGTSGVVPADEPFVFRTGSFTVGAGQERFVCYAKTLDEDLVIDGFDYPSSPIVHHLLLVRTTAPEPDGFSDCPVLFRPSWLPMFGAATAAARLQLPDGVGMTLPRGTQIMVQIHSLNGTARDAEGVVEIALHRSARRDLATVGLYAFGKTELSLPPRQVSESAHDCAPADDLDIFAVLPHMHYLGKSLRFEMGTSAGDLREVYRRDPWSFDEQFLDPLPLAIPKGTMTRVTCTFDNETDRTVTFGESSHDEMCFLVAYARGRDGLEGCDVVSISPPADGACGPQHANERGIGAPCTRGGHECARGMVCSLDEPQTPPGSAGFCLQIGGCETAADCGSGATCCAPAQAGGLINVCLPEACRPSDCAPR